MICALLSFFEGEHKVRSNNDKHLTIVAIRDSLSSLCFDDFT